MSTLKEYQDELKLKGGVLIKGFVEPSVALDWAERARSGVKNRMERESGEVKNLDEGGAYSHGIASASQVKEILPEMFGLYQSTAAFLSLLIERDVITSPYPESSVTLKVYDRPNDQQGWHKDTNPLTALLILTETKGNYGTEIEFNDGTAGNLENNPGDLWVMYGRELRHRVPSVPEGKWRVTVPLNYYHPDDTWRPADMDKLVYG